MPVDFVTMLENRIRINITQMRLGFTDIDMRQNRIAMNVMIIIPSRWVGHGGLLHHILVIDVAAKADRIRLNANTILVEDPNDDNYDDRDDSDDDRDECSDYHT